MQGLFSPERRGVMFFGCRTLGCWSWQRCCLPFKDTLLVTRTKNCPPHADVWAFDEFLYSQRSVLFHFRNVECLERCVGVARLVRQRETGKVRFVTHEENLPKIIGMFLAVDAALFRALVVEKSWGWSASDFSDVEQRYVW